MDLRKDLARRAMPSDGPYSPEDKVFVWMKDESKKKSEGIWVRGKVVSQEGAMVRRDHDPWHDVAVPLDPEPAVHKVKRQLVAEKALLNIHTCAQATNANAVLSTRSVSTPSPVRRAIL